MQVRVCASSEELMARMEPLFPPNARRLQARLTVGHRIGIVEEDDGTYSVYNGATRVNEGGGVELSLVVFDGQVRSYVAVHAPDYIFVHAGAVALDGKALVLPGDSFAGKTTLVEALVRAGAAYYSDEFAVFDSEGLCHPYPKPLSLRPRWVDENSPQGPQVEQAVESLGGVAGEGAIPMGMAVITYYVPGSESRPRELGRGEAALALIAKAVPTRNRPQQTLATLSRAIDGAVVLEGERGEAEEFAAMLRDRVMA